MQTKIGFANSHKTLPWQSQRQTFYRTNKSVIISFVLKLFLKGALLGLRQFLAAESPLKMIFISCLKFFSVSRYLKFCLEFLVRYENSSIRKLRLISKFMTSQKDKQVIIIHIFPNISGSKGNQRMKFSQLIEYNVRNIFFKNHATIFFPRNPNFVF